MITLPKESKNAVKLLKKFIASNNKTEDKMFRVLCKFLKIAPDSKEGETLWDHIYNDSDWNVKYE